MQSLLIGYVKGIPFVNRMYMYMKLKGVPFLSKMVCKSSGGSRGGARRAPPPLFFNQNEAQRAEKKFFGDFPPHPLSQGLDDRAPLI